MTNSMNEDGEKTFTINATREYVQAWGVPRALAQLKYPGTDEQKKKAADALRFLMSKAEERGGIMLSRDEFHVPAVIEEGIAETKFRQALQDKISSGNLVLRDEHTYIRIENRTWNFSDLMHVDDLISFAAEAGIIIARTAKNADLDVAKETAPQNGNVSASNRYVHWIKLADTFHVFADNKKNRTYWKNATSNACDNKWLLPARRCSGRPGVAATWDILDVAQRLLGEPRHMNINTVRHAMRTHFPEWLDEFERFAPSN